MSTMWPWRAFRSFFDYFGSGTRTAATPPEPTVSTEGNGNVQSMPSLEEEIEEMSWNAEPGEDEASSSSIVTIVEIEEPISSVVEPENEMSSSSIITESEGEISSIVVDTLDEILSIVEMVDYISSVAEPEGENSSIVETSDQISSIVVEVEVEDQFSSIAEEDEEITSLIEGIGISQLEGEQQTQGTTLDGSSSYEKDEDVVLLNMDAEGEPPVKRGRGRPRKNPLPLTPVASTSSGSGSRPRKNARLQGRQSELDTVSRLPPENGFRRSRRLLNKEIKRRGNSNNQEVQVKKILFDPTGTHSVEKLIFLDELGLRMLTEEQKVARAVRAVVEAEEREAAAIARIANANHFRACESLIRALVSCPESLNQKRSLRR